ncbi:hypothetical protein L5515_010065 [Caenorhabditis briggsae]|uniref:DUF4139 domain-containing protein n=2 Tax=Caenorhabditis briggsae TaxID=6238 RepID=A0AAE9JFD8_CAEBR|nr:hypothetical protein L5515_010065 [Caenorhabditis briggsae]
MDMTHETDKILQIERQKIEVENERFAIEDECCSIKKRIDVLDGVAGQISSGPAAMPFSSSNQGSSHLPASGSQPHLVRRHTVTGQEPNPLAMSTTPMSNGFFFNHESLDNLAKFLSYYGDAVRDMKKELRKRQRETQQLSEKIDQLDRQLDQLRCVAEYDSIKRNISIVVEMEESGKVELYITYQVYCASWKPCYDIRASSAEEEEDSQNGSSVQLCYYGLVEQNTGDDWKDCDIVLSTCSASLGGSPPPLSTLSASLHSSRPTRRHHASSAARRKAPLSIPSEEDMGFGSFDYNDIVDAAAYHRWHNGQHSRSSEENSVSTQALENTVSTCFSIPRAVTILSNAVEHKLLIVKSDLSCAFSHETVPSRATSAYLSALITNTSQLPLLPGAVAVYVNNCFVTKTHLRLVSPGEEFRCNMGVDPSVKVEYKTPTRSYEQVGFMSKSTLMTHEQLISVRSAKVRQSVKITVKEQIPKSHDDKIKVSIVSPEIKSSSSSKNSASPPDARLNKDHNLEWCVVLAPGQHRLLPVRYTIEHPASESLSYKLN